jgi:hypothetical protein
MKIDHHIDLKREREHNEDKKNISSKLRKKSIVCKKQN